MQIEIQCQIEKIISRNKTNCFTVAKVKKIYEHTIELDMPATAEPIIVGIFQEYELMTSLCVKVDGLIMLNMVINLK